MGTQKSAIQGLFLPVSLGSCRILWGEVEVQGDAGEGSRPFGTLPSTGCHYQRSPVPRNVLPAPVGARAATRQRRRGWAVQRGAPDDGVGRSEVGGVNPPSRKASRMPNKAWPASQVTVSSTHSKAWAPGTAPRGSGTGGYGAQGSVAASGSRKAPGARARGAVCGDRGRASRLASGQGLSGTPSLHPSVSEFFFS